MKRVTCWVFGHNLMRDVCFYDFSDWLIDLKERQPVQQFEGILLAWERAAFELFKYCLAGVAVI